MRVNKFFFCSLLLFLLLGCAGSSFYEKLNDGYYLSAIDVNEDMVIGYQDGNYGIGIIEATIFAVGQNQEFIIAKQHPRKFPESMNKTITNYFIIPLKNKISKSVEKNFYGPLTLKGFEQKRKELNIPDSVTFTKVIKELE